MMIGITAAALLSASQDSTVIFLVRHAEKTNEGQDPRLSEAGKIRASYLASMLKDASIDYIHSSDYKRTRDTAAPVADLLGLQLQIYDPRALEKFASELRQSPGRHLVVGHSNTTPQMAKLLGGDGGPEINEAGEYDRLYMLNISADGGVDTVLLRYGQAYTP
jgi:phosphohistidine phosphatase SixA